MKICRIVLKDFQQFKHLDLDLTHPGTGEPLEKICFIGGNGTGKSTLLRWIANFGMSTQGRGAMQFEHKGKRYFAFQGLQVHGVIGYYEENLEATHNLEEFLNLDLSSFNPTADKIAPFRAKVEVLEEMYAAEDGKTLIYMPPESNTNEYGQIIDVPRTSLNEALSLFDSFPNIQTVANDKASDFWKLLVWHLKKRDNDFREFQNKPENLEKKVREVRDAFDQEHPDILASLAGFWNKILGKAGLEFDYESASNPIQLNDNLKAYIRLKSTKETIPYNQLSTGIRNFIFKLGHIYALYFNRRVESGFLLVDEPENSLFPDFLYDLVDAYTSITHNTQLFMATHNPIVAAQFQPWERFILEFENSTGFVQVRRGVAPAGDDPNDVLVKDFGIRSLLGREGVRKWERYIELKTLIPLEKNSRRKEGMIEEFMKIGGEYNFEANEVS